MNYIPSIISFLSLLLAGYIFFRGNTKENATELTTVIVKLETIGSGISDIKSELAHLKDDQKEDHDKLIKMESSLATAWKRIDEMKDGHANI